MITFLKKYLAAPYIPIIWTVIIAILMCLPGRFIPSEKTFRIPNFDKFVHTSLFCGFVFLWGLYRSNRTSALHILLRNFFIFYVMANIYGIGMEYVQKYYIPGRDYDLEDIIADMVGAGIGYGLCNLLLLTSADTTDTENT